MPRSHGRIASNAEIVAGRRNHSHLRRSLDERNHRLSSEERQLSTLVLGNTDQRCIIFTLVSPELDDYCKLATIIQSLKVPDQRNHLPSAVIYESPPAITLLVNPQKPDLSESKCIPNSSSVCSSNVSIMQQSCNRNKRSKSLKDLSNNFAPRCMTVDTSSGSPSDGPVSDTSKVEKPIKRSSKKKGKKKGKRYKRSSFKKDSSELDGHYEGGSYSSPVIETSVDISPACLNNQVSDNLSDNASFPPSFVAEDNTIEKDVSDNNNHTDSSATMMSCMSFNDDMEESEAVACLSQGFAHEEYTDNNFGELKSTSSAENVPSTVSLNIKSASLKDIINCNGNSSSFYVDLYDDNDASFGSFQNSRKISVSENCRKDVETRLSINGDDGGDTSVEVDSNFRKCDPSFEGTTINSFHINNGVSHDYDYGESFVCAHGSTDRVQCSSEASSTNGFQTVKSGKRARAARKMMVHTGNDNNHAVWQKVERINTRHCINEANNVSAVLPKAETLSKASGARVRLNSSAGLDQNVKTSKSFHPSENNVKKKHIVSKQVQNYSRKGSSNDNVNFARHSKFHVQQKEGMKILSPVNHDEHATSGLRSPYNNSTEKHIQEAILPRNTFSVAGQMTSAVACNQIDMSLSTLDSLGQVRKIDIEGHTDQCDFRGKEKTHDDLYRMDNTDQNKKPECSLAEYREANNISACELYKWVPAEKTNAAMSHMGHAENERNSVTNESVSYMLVNKNLEAEVSPDVQFCIPLTRSEMQGSSGSGDDADCSSSETDILSDKLMSCSCTDLDLSVPNGSNFQLTHGVKDRQFSKFESGLEKILHAVNNAYKFYTAAGVDLIADSLLAELERFIYSASPVISLRHHNRVFMPCSLGRHTGSCMSFHQLHNISLASLWQWYEEPGCYGLEVKVEDNHNSKRLHDGSVEFRAYFVPYLSAVQIFGRSDSTYANSNVEVISSEIAKASRSSSNLGSLPILSVLLPQPHKEVNACSLESTSPAINEFCNESLKDTNLNDEELIFEYFEHAQPPQRRPLFEKIKELVNCDRSSNSNIFGDPSMLECLSLHDIHPASWYAVAWYPIYRIPEGNFRAAFLTFHSLGHFIDQSASCTMGGDFTRIISPVVGLQSYNAKKECWFQERDTKFVDVQKEEASISSPSKFLEERLRTLEQTASVMAKATVRKGNERSVNNHPDYNHFFSRW